MRIATRLGLALVALVAVAAVGVWIYLDRAVELALERGGERALGVATTVGSVRVEPFGGTVGLADVRIANPEGFGDAPFLAVGDGRVDVAMSTLGADVVRIDRIELRDLALRLESRGGRANYESLGRTRAAGSGDDAGRGVIVRELVLRDVVAHVDREVLDTGAGDLVVRIPEIALRDVGSHSDGGVLASELSSVVVAAIVRAMVEKGVALPISLVRRTATLPLDVGVEVTGAVARAIGGVADEGERVARDVLGGAVDEGVRRATGALRSILGGGEAPADEESTPR